MPAGYDLLCDALEADAELRKNFFRRLDRMSYAGSAISRATLENLYRLGRLTTGRSIPVTSGYGTTETAPTISNAHWAIEQPGELGLPAPGLKLKLVPVTDTYEVASRARMLRRDISASLTSRRQPSTKRDSTGSGIRCRLSTVSIPIWDCASPVGCPRTSSCPMVRGSLYRGSGRPC